ncbi:MAG: PEP-CTERM sorting domain-containing protein [Aquabacterium sp.]|nr:PEP-CTERM sorting domain-containing protein [Aquabacterium sp.]
MSISKVLFASALAALSAQAFAAPFAVNDLVVYRVGTGSGALGSTSTAVFLDEFTKTGALVQSIALPTVASGVLSPVTASGSATSEGQINRSVDGKSLVLTGYGTTTGTASVAGSTAAAVPRQVVTVAADGSLTTKAVGTLLGGNNVRTAATVDGTGTYAAGGAGVAYVNGSGVATQLSTTNTRDLVIADNQLFYSTGSGTTGIYSLGTGLPNSGSFTGTLLAASASPFGFLFADLSNSVTGVDTLYVADDNATTGGIRKFSKSVAGVWSLNNTIVVSGVRGLTGVVNGGQVQLFATSATNLYGLTDSTGYNANLSAAVTTLATAAANTAFRGLALTPAVPEPATYGLALVSLALFGAMRRLRG